mgnify:CR=1 FL=1
MPRITNTRDDRAFASACDDTILRAALRAGIGMSYSCNVGSSGNCKVEHMRADAPAWSERDLKRPRRGRPLRARRGAHRRSAEHVHCTAALSEPASGWAGRRGFLHEVVKSEIGESLKDQDIYFAAPPAMAQAVPLMAHEAGVPPSQLHFDQFY